MKKMTRYSLSKKNLYLKVEFSGYGHWKLTTTRYGKEVSMTTTDAGLVENIKDGIITAKIKAVRMVRHYYFSNI